jgi:ketosteroid isomerase-like protein
MSPDHVEIARRGYEAFNAREMEVVYASLDPEVVWEEWSAAPDARIYYGHDGVREFFDKLWESFDLLRFEPEEFIEVGDQIVVPTVVRVSGRGSGAEATLSTVHVWTYRGGKGVRVRVYETKAEALEAVGPGE